MDRTVLASTAWKSVTAETRLTCCQIPGRCRSPSLAGTCPSSASAGCTGTTVAPSMSVHSLSRQQTSTTAISSVSVPVRVAQVAVKTPCLPAAAKVVQAHRPSFVYVRHRYGYVLRLRRRLLDRYVVYVPVSTGRPAQSEPASRSSGDFLKASAPPSMVNRAVSSAQRPDSMASPSWSVAVKVATGSVPFSA